MYELMNGDTKNPNFVHMIEFQDTVNDIYIEFKTKYVQTSAPRLQTMNEEEFSHTLKSTRIPSNVFGVQNIGNTCFFNSTMQALNATRELVDYYVSNHEMFDDYDHLLGSKICLI